MHQDQKLYVVSNKAKKRPRKGKDVCANVMIIDMSKKAMLKTNTKKVQDIYVYVNGCVRMRILNGRELCPRLVVVA